MKKAIRAIIIGGALFAGCVTPTPAPTATPTEGTTAPAPTPVEPTEVPTTESTHTPTSTAAPTPVPPTATPLAQIRASCYPDASAPLEDLVILRGPEHLFDPSCEVSDGVGEITASWDIDGDGSPESEATDPPAQLCGRAPAAPRSTAAAPPR